MKTYLRISIAMMLAAWLLMAATPALAGDVQTEVTGAMYLLTSGEPVETYWITGQYIDHGRNEIQGYYFDISDPRLDGWGWGYMDWDWHSKADGTFAFAHIHGTTVITADEAGQVVLWECATNTFISGDWVLSASNICRGRGENEGLLAKLTGIMDLPSGDLYFNVEGVILETGKK